MWAWLRSLASKGLSRTATWSVCTQFIDGGWDPARFIDHYLALGCDEIVVFIEAGDPPALVASHAKVRVIDVRPGAGAARPAGLDRQQTRSWNIDHCRSLLRSDYILAVDLDVFLIPEAEGQSIAGILAKVPGRTDVPVTTIFETVYLPTDDIEIAYAARGMRTGPAEGEGPGGILKRTYGAYHGLFTGAFAERHVQPVFYRRDRQEDAGRRVTSIKRLHLRAVCVAPDFSSWRARFTQDLEAGRASETDPAIAAQLAAFAACAGDVEKQRELFWELHTFIDRQSRLLAEASLYSPMPDKLKKSLYRPPADGVKRAAPLSHRLFNARSDFSEVMRKDLFNGDMDSFSARLMHMGLDSFYDRRRKLETSTARSDRRMLFIAGLHRSGTTLLEDHVASRFKVARLRAPVPENEGQFLQDLLPSEQIYGGPGSFAFYQGMRASIPETVAERAEIRERILSLWETWVVGDSDVLMEKSPPNITRVPYLRAVFQGAKFVFFVRDPRAVSMSTQKWNNLPVPVLFMHWVAAHSAMLHAVADDCLVLRYEDLCADVEGTLNRIGEFAGLEANEIPGETNSRFTTIENQNAKYIAAFGTLPANIRNRTALRPWEILGYDLDDHFK